MKNFNFKIFISLFLLTFFPLQGQDVVRVVDLAGTYYILNEYTTVGTSTFEVPEGVDSVDVLVIGGGGAGGSKFSNERGAGGGGAGGFVEIFGYDVSGQSSISIVVGAGGEALDETESVAFVDPQDTTTRPRQLREPERIKATGKDSKFGSITAFGGGHGGGGSFDFAVRAGVGASGGGAPCCGVGNNSIGASPIGVTPEYIQNPNPADLQGDQGWRGGDGTIATQTGDISDRHGGGGGGAGGAGENATLSGSTGAGNFIPGAGGSGIVSVILGDSVCAGGNGVGSNPGGQIRLPSLNNQSDGRGLAGQTGGDAVDNSGGGGGAGRAGGGDGGSGIVIVLYKLSDVTGDLTIPGPITFEDGTEINGNITVEGDVIVDNSVVIVPNASLEVEGDLTVNENATITLQANTDGEYAMLKFDGDFIGNGTVIQQQYFTGGWHMVSSSMEPTNAGFFGQVSADRHPNAFNFFSWNGVGYDLVPNNAASIDNRIGYYGFVGENNGTLVGFRDVGMQSFEGTPNTSTNLLPLTNLGADTTGGSSGGGTWSFTVDGQILSGWNMVGNPFTAALDFTTLNFSDNNSVEEAFYIFEPINGTDGGSFQSYSGAGINEPFISPFQSFWLRVTDDNITMDGLNMISNSVIPANYPTFYRSPIDKVVLRVFEKDNTDNHDYTVIAFVEGTSDDFDNGWDARKMPNGGDKPSLYTKGSVDGLANNAIDYNFNYHNKRSINLGLIAPKQGEEYNISFDDSYLSNSYSIFLEDRKLNHFHNLVASDYNFYNDTSDSERFVLHFRSGLLNSDLEFNKTSFRAWVYQDIAYIHPNIDLGLKNIKVIDLSGRTVFTTSEYLNANEKAEIPLPKLKPGIYLLNVDYEIFKFVVH